MNSNPYYEERLKTLNFALEKILNENKEIEEQNNLIKKSLDDLENMINENVETITKSIETIKN